MTDIEVSVLELKVLPLHPYQFSLGFLKALCLAPYCSRSILMALTMSCPIAACICIQMIFFCIGLYIFLQTIKPCKLTLMHYLILFQPTSYSLTVISATVRLCPERGIPPRQLYY